MAWVVFGAVVLVMLALDLGVFHRKAHAIGTREAAVWSAVWISVALLFNLGIYLHSGSDRALEFFQAWLIEKALSVDNLFVFLVAFSYFAVPAQPAAPRAVLGNPRRADHARRLHRDRRRAARERSTGSSTSSARS